MKKITCVFISVLLLCLLAATASAAPSRLADDGELLTAQEEAAVASKLDAVSREYGIDVVVVTVDHLGGKSAQAYADDYYNNGGYGEDGVLLLVSMRYREWSVSTSGTCIRAFDDAALDAIEEEVIPYLTGADYAEAFNAFAQLCGNAMETYAAGPSGPSILICVIGGVVVAFIVTGSMKAKLTSVRAQADARSYVDPGSFALTRRLDLFMYRNVSRRPRPQDSSGSHRSSSGRSHGGRSGRF